ncbi:P-loop containing nucleoside triphosphate hydrolase protein [Syncephalis fuscata]|nr:P-loop containing nucleoside triphosphate hydrolase protein [Syncephalis fuscata]
MASLPIDNPKVSIVVIMGVSACGKTTMARQLAQYEASQQTIESAQNIATSDLLNPFYIEADDYHPPANRVKMASGVALEDEDRWPWLAALCQAVNQQAQQLTTSLNQTTNHKPTHIYLACSCLKRAYRDIFRHQLKCPVCFLYLHISKLCAQQRATMRTHHFMPASLVDSQFATLEIPTQDEQPLDQSDVITVDGELNPHTLLNTVIETLAQ